MRSFLIKYLNSRNNVPGAIPIDALDEEAAIKKFRNFFCTKFQITEITEITKK